MLVFIKGEKRILELQVTSCSDDNFVISTAKVDLTKNNEIVVQLPILIKEKSINVTIDTADLNVGYYNLVVTYSVNEEILKRKFEVEIAYEY